jgi:hypothetical protein|tara:strand:+ start:371 stop:997 length:627 start_codon:yes stop_codon:yes gene_type:complete
MFVDINQNSDEWFALRLGKVTSSNFGKIMANLGKDFGSPAIEYAQKIALEYVTGERDESSSFKNEYMIRGQELEPVAVELYERETFYSVTNGGFNQEDSEEPILLGDSPDGNVGKDGCIEIKSVIPNTQWKRIKKGGIDTAYKWQIHGHIWLGNKQWCDFISFCPEMPKNKQLHIFRVDRDDIIIELMAERLDEFKGVVMEHVELLLN